jgi:serine/threonine protein kinase
MFHRDLKPENVLIDHSGHVKICDFGFTAPCSDDESDLRDGCGTAMYIAPEVASGFMKGTHGFPVDWWALGCVLYEMIAGEAPFGDSDSLSKFEIFNNITEKTVLYPLRMSQNVKQLLKGLLDKKPNSRSNWRQVSSSPWLSDVSLFSRSHDRTIDRLMKELCLYLLAGQLDISR